MNLAVRLLTCKLSSDILEMRASHTVANACTIPVNASYLICQDAHVLLWSKKDHYVLRFELDILLNLGLATRGATLTSEVVASFDDIGSVASETSIDSCWVEALCYDEWVIRR